MGNSAIEIGSEYHLDISELTVKEPNLFNYMASFPYVMYYDSGRSALWEFVSLLKKKQRILLPEYICESVIRCFSQHQIQFYKVLPDLSIDLEDLRIKMDTSGGVLFFMQYFGKLMPEQAQADIKKLACRFDWLILEDATHIFFGS